jgi:hypothetical protein
MILLNQFNGLETADSGGAIDIRRAVALVANNTINKPRITDLGGGIFCEVPNFSPAEGDPMAAVRMIRHNLVNGAASSIDGSCVYFTTTCGVQVRSPPAALHRPPFSGLLLMLAQARMSASCPLRLPAARSCPLLPTQRMPAIAGRPYPPCPALATATPTFAMPPGPVLLTRCAAYSARSTSLTTAAAVTSCPAQRCWTPSSLSLLTWADIPPRCGYC